MKTAEEALSEATVGVSVIAERCKKGNGLAEFWVDLQPSGKVMMSVQFFVEGSELGRCMQAYIGWGIKYKVGVNRSLMLIMATFI